MRWTRYPQLLWAFFKVSAIADLEYRFNFLLRIGIDICWYAVQVSIFEVIFRHTDRLSGWTVDEMRVFLGVLFVVDAFWMILFSENIMAFSTKIRRGDLDLLLAKPIDSQFMVSLQRISTPFFGNLCLGSGWLIWALHGLDHGFYWPRLMWLFMMIPSSVAIIYASRFFFSASALFLGRAENVSFLWYQLYKLGTRPDSLYPKWLRYLVLSAIPVGFVASVPSRIILGKSDWTLVGAAWLMAVAVIYLSKRYWRWALRFYASASS